MLAGQGFEKVYNVKGGMMAWEGPVADGPVELNIYSVQGALIRTLVSEVMDPGRHEAVWDGTDRYGQRVSSEVYLARLVTRDATGMTKLVLLK